MYTEELAAEILFKMERGQTVEQICRLGRLTNPDYPEASTVRRWARVNEGGTFSSAYSRAKQLSYEVYAEELVSIADEGHNDYMEREREAGVIGEYNQEHVARSKMRLDTRKWILAKMIPKVYGEKTTTEHVGAGGGPIQSVSVVTNDPTEAAKLYQKMMEASSGGEPEDV